MIKISPLRSLIITTLLFCWSCNPLLAQKERDWVVKTDPVSMLAGPFWNYQVPIPLFYQPITGGLNLSVENLQLPFIGIEVGASYLYETPLIDWDERLGEGDDVESVKIDGYRFFGAVKMYFLDGAEFLSRSKGPYFGSYFSIARMYGEVDYNTEREQISIYGRPIDITQINVGFIQCGYQFLLKKKYALDLFTRFSSQFIDKQGGYTKRDYRTTHTVVDRVSHFSGLDPSFRPIGGVKLSFGFKIGIFLGKEDDAD